MDSSYEYNKDFQKLVSVSKDALVVYFEDNLKSLQTVYEMRKDYLEKMLERAKELK